MAIKAKGELTVLTTQSIILITKPKFRTKAFQNDSFIKLCLETQMAIRNKTYGCNVTPNNIELLINNVQSQDRLFGV